jgi:hypothetical protein
MKYLVYISTARELFTDEELRHLLEISRANNSSKRVTGMLLYHDGAIFQTLEGDETIIDELFARISRDGRHNSILKMFEGYGDVRYFNDWSMAFRRLDATQWKEVRGFIEPDNLINKYINKAIATSEIMTLLRSFAMANFKAV